jgi:hypothetical protein
MKYSELRDTKLPFVESHSAQPGLTQFYGKSYSDRPGLLLKSNNCKVDHPNKRDPDADEGSTVKLASPVWVFWQRTPRNASQSIHFRRQSARMSLGCGLFSILSAMIGLSITLETGKPEWLDPEFGHRLARIRDIQKENPRHSLVIALGTSRTQNAIQPSSMGFLDEAGAIRMFNFGQSGASPLKILMTLMRLLDTGIKPAAILVEVLPVWLTMDGPAEEQFRDKASQLSRVDLQRLAPYCNDPDDLQSQWLAARAAPWYSQRISLMSHWLPQWMPWQVRINSQWQRMETDGFVPFLYTVPTPEFRTEATAKTQMQYAGSFGGFRVTEMSKRALRDLVERCRAEDIPIAFFIPPVAPTFRGWFEPAAWLSGESDLRVLCMELNVDLFPSSEQVTDDDFADGHHMLRMSAERYSRWLAETHIRAWYSRNQSPSSKSDR